MISDDPITDREPETYLQYIDAIATEGDISTIIGLLSL